MKVRGRRRTPADAGQVDAFVARMVTAVPWKLGCTFHGYRNSPSLMRYWIGGQGDHSAHEHRGRSGLRCPLGRCVCLWLPPEYDDGCLANCRRISPAVLKPVTARVGDWRASPGLLPRPYGTTVRCSGSSDTRGPSIRRRGQWHYLPHPYRSWKQPLTLRGTPTIQLLDDHGLVLTMPPVHDSPSGMIPTYPNDGVQLLPMANEGTPPGHNPEGGIRGQASLPLQYHQDGCNNSVAAARIEVAGGTFTVPLTIPQPGAQGCDVTSMVVNPFQPAEFFP